MTGEVTPAPVTPAVTRLCRACGKPLPPQHTGRPRKRHEGCRGDAAVPVAVSTHRVPLPEQPQHEVLWSGANKHVSLVGDLERRNSQPARTVGHRGAW